MGDSEIEMKEGNEIFGNNYNVGEISEVDEKLCDSVVISMESMLEGVAKVNAKYNTIYQIPKELREMNEKAYTPQFISIGPFHHGTRNDLIANEQYKHHGFINFLRRINNNKIKSMDQDQGRLQLKDLVKKAYCWVKEARNCYASAINMKEEEFVIMMLVDACFIVEFLIVLVYGLYQEDDKLKVDFLFYQGVFQEIVLDLIKLENQVPFFLLQRLFDLVPKDNDEEDEDGFISLIKLTYMALKFLGFVRKYDINCLNFKEPKHLLDFLSFFFYPLPPVDIEYKQDEKNSENNNNNFLSFCGLLFPACGQKKINNDLMLSFFLRNKKPDDHDHDPEKGCVEWRLSPPSITELCEAGVTIKVAENENLCFMNISFKNGVLEIPCICIESTFEFMIRNVIAFDHYPAGNQKQYAIQYVLFIDDLINTEQDVHLLVKAGVIINTFGGSDKEISDLFNNLSKFVLIPVVSHFDDISKDLRAHCDRRWNKAKATLKHDYFNTPWAVISFFAATFLILLTLLQTIFSVISAFPN